MDEESPLTDRLEEILVGGLTPVRVEVVDYDPAWPTSYDRYSRRLLETLGDRIRLMEHIGSTAVPGLAAKRVIDIVVGVDDPDDEAAYVPDLVVVGYDVRVREPGHRCLRGGDVDLPVNLHCYRPDSVEIERYLVFRDRLRSSHSDRELYASTKRGLAGRVWPDMNVYAEAKSDVVEEILGRARRRP
jgi:GrpB-like predicted nucleotidyltransferase (UPF0157 family)